MDMQHFTHLKEGPSQRCGGFPSEPIEDLGSIRVMNKTSKQEVWCEVMVKTTKFIFFWDCSVCVSDDVSVFSEFEWRGDCKTRDST